MVRTYAFNPSTQHSASLPGARERESYLQHAIIPHRPSSPQHLPYLPFPIEMQTHPLDASFSTTSSSSSSGHNPMEGSLTIFGIRSVIIDGQLYYQPIDSDLQRAITQQVNAMGISKSNSSNSSTSSPPQDPGPELGHSGPKNLTDNNSQAMFTAMHMASALVITPENRMMMGGQENGGVLPVEKHFSEYDPAIRRNMVGGALPAIKQEKAGHTVENGAKDGAMIDDLPPWARGNPQPRSGKRGTIDWNLGQTTNGTILLPNASTLYFDKPPLLSNEPTHGSHSLLNSFGSTLARALPLPRQNPAPPQAELYRSFASSYNPIASPPPIHYPLHQSNSYGSFYTDPNAATSFITAPYKYVNPYPPGHEKHEKERHKLDLLQQIEDNRRRKEMEKQREWEIEERERIRGEMFAARQRAEVEEEQRKQHDQALAAERKAARLAESNQDFLSKAKPRQPSASRQRRSSVTSQKSTNGGLEWWEKKRTWDENRGKSPIIPALAQQAPQRRNSEQNLAAMASTTSVSPPNDKMTRRTPSPITRQRSVPPPQSPMRRNEPNGSAKQSRSISRASRRSYQPTIASRSGSRLDESLRNLSATRRQLDDEQRRVKDAINNHTYGRGDFFE